MKQFFTLISNLLISLAFDLAYRRTKPLKIMVFLSHFDYFWEELSKLTLPHKGQTCYNSLWLDSQRSWKQAIHFSISMVKSSRGWSIEINFNLLKYLIRNLPSPENSLKFGDLATPLFTLVSDRSNYQFCSSNFFNFEKECHS